MEIQSVCDTFSPLMTTQILQISASLSEWILAIVVIFVTFLVTTTIRSIAKRLAKKNEWSFLNRIPPSIYHFLYVLGFKIAAEAAPLHGKMQIWIESGLYVSAVLLFFFILQQAALASVEWGSSRALGLNHKFIPLLKNVTILFTFTSASIIVLRFFNYDVMSLVAALGVGSLAIGLAAKDTLSNMISGFIVIIDNNIRPGDRINLNGTVGDIYEIGLRSSLMRLTDGNTLVVPNSELINSRIINLTIPTQETICTIHIRVPYSVPLSLVKNHASQILQQSPYVAQERSNWTSIISLSEGFQLIQVGFWINKFTESREAISELNEKLLIQFRAENIELVPPSLLISKDLPR